jgi:hypothetical protein
LPSEQDWPDFSTLFSNVFPSGIPKRPEQKSLGSLRNFFKYVPETAQSILADDETLEII